MATHSSVLAWRIPGTGEPGGLMSLGSQSRTQLKRLSSSSSIPFLYPQQYEWPSFSITVPAFAIVTIPFSHYKYIMIYNCGLDCNVYVLFSEMVFVSFAYSLIGLF